MKIQGKKTRVSVVGMNAVCGAGFNKYQIYDNVLNEKSSVNTRGLAPIDSQAWETYLSTVVIPGEFKVNRSLPWLFHCLQDSIRESGWDSLEQVGIIFASTTSSIDCWENELPLFEEDRGESLEKLISHQSLAEPLQVLTKYWGIKGPQVLLSSSCSASLQALALGALWIETGFVDRCIVATSEVLSNLTATGFEALRLLSKDICKPFAKDRNGINLGEAAGVICLESTEKLSDNKKCLGFISGYGFSSDAFHPTSPEPAGEGSVRAIRAALDKAGLEPDEIDWIYAHGTASKGNDAAELEAFKNIFGHTSLPTVFSSKPIHGHTLAASGVLESIIGLMALSENKKLELAANESSLLNSNLDLKSKDEKKAGKSNRVSSHILKNSLGFGGINVALVLSRN